MSYNKKIWANGDIITKEGMNNIEDGIYTAHDEIQTLKNSMFTNVKNMELLEMVLQTIQQLCKQL